ncbi:nucleoside deaminase [Legionella septentrionalis]|uniref:Nucleoside deaminase n=1 Tax=Legionella septentrionalis TaxID=2498109 RepID=A0A433JHC6_9GAMM|nr:deaminase [Legionella septentrionalis]RUQ81716.1 nucleoside deaminase [Legionella septentrionalis]RUR02781.1 nucleoside deaminase [Legionella septentrionalis]RUR11379.1 nucleoside deaminase [Legionella septentrionalis]
MNNYIYNFMRETIEVAALNPKAPYASILVYDDRDILVKSVNNSHVHPLMHGELSVLNILFNDGFSDDRTKLSIYSTAEPCPMCAAAIYWSMIPKIIYGTSIPFLHNLFGRQIQVRAKEIFSKTPNFYNCNLIEGVMENECNSLFIKAKEIRDLESIS